MLIANHISWVDIFVINAVITSRFVAKSEVRSWPVLGWLCEKTGTLFITRERRHDTRRVNKQIADALTAGACIAVFPEGSTTDGTDVANFNASLIQPAIDADTAIQAIALRYIDAAGAQSTSAAYVGDMSLVESLARLLAARRTKAIVTLLPPISACGQDRRAIAKSIEADIRDIVRSR
jgi:1-acyl-sn-glycerol-3-phosphate acyltransferase